MNSYTSEMDPARLTVSDVKKDSKCEINCGLSRDMLDEIDNSSHHNLVRHCPECSESARGWLTDFLTQAQWRATIKSLSVAILLSLATLPSSAESIQRLLENDCAIWKNRLANAIESEQEIRVSGSGWVCGTPRARAEQMVRDACHTSDKAVSELVSEYRLALRSKKH